MRLFAAVLALSSCDAPRCLTPCGVAIVGEAVSCDAFARLETALVERMPLTDSCANLDGYTAVALPGLTTTRDGEAIDGWSNCEARELYFHAGWAPGRSAYVHELAHAIQGCRAALPVDPHRDVDHSDWTRTGIGRAVLEARQTATPD